MELNTSDLPEPDSSSAWTSPPLSVATSDLVKADSDSDDIDTCDAPQESLTSRACSSSNIWDSDTDDFIDFGCYPVSDTSEESDQEGMRS